VTEPPKSQPTRLERIFTYMSIAVIGISILSMIVVLVARLVGANSDGSANMFWSFLTMLPWAGLPIGFALIVVLMILNWRRRAREARESSRS